MSKPTPMMQDEIRLEKGEGRSFWLLTDLYTFKVVGDDTKGAYTVIELTAGPGPGAPPHIHRHCAESFYILDGTIEFSLAGRPFTASAGAFVHLPKGVTHSHRAAGDTSARALLIQSPAGVEHFFAEAGTPAGTVSGRLASPDQSDLERIVAIAQRHGIEVPSR
jgi:quercetin dioxygenase-like cupin family protein